MKYRQSVLLVKSNKKTKVRKRIIILYTRFYGEHTLELHTCHVQIITIYNHQRKQAYIINVQSHGCKSLLGCICWDESEM